MSFGAFFLRDALRFPARIAGSPCGDCTVSVQVAGITFQFSGLSQTQLQAIRRWATTVHCHLPVNSDSPVCKARVFRAEPAEFLDVDFEGGVYTYDRDYQSSGVRLCGWNFMSLVRFEPEFNIGVWVRPTDDLVDFGIFENVLRLLVAYRLVGSGGVLLHSAALATLEGAYVFFGPSGAGKSTLSGLGASLGYSILSDDLNVLRVDGNQLVCQKVPFAGQLRARSGNGVGQKFKVQGLYRLCKSNRHEVHRLSEARGVASLFAASPFVNSDPHRVTTLLDSLERIVAMNQVSELMFKPDAGFASLLEYAH